MSRRRATGSAALIALLSVVLCLLVGAAPAHATEVDKRIGYHCSSAYGSGNTSVRVRVSIPDLINQGRLVDPQRVRFSIRVPAALVDAMRDYGVDSVSGHGRAWFTVGSLKRPIRHLHLRERTVPDSGGMVLRGSGRTAEFRINRPGTYAVKVTRNLSATATIHGGAFDGASADLSCNVRRGESRRLASIEVIR